MWIPRKMTGALATGGGLLLAYLWSFADDALRNQELAKPIR